MNIMRLNIFNTVIYCVVQTCGLSFLIQTAIFYIKYINIERFIC